MPRLPTLIDDLEAHYSCLERMCTCFGGYVALTLEEDGEEYEEAVARAAAVLLYQPFVSS